jgi:hypothetical protein
VGLVGLALIVVGVVVVIASPAHVTTFGFFSYRPLYATATRPQHLVVMSPGRAVGFCLVVVGALAAVGNAAYAVGRVSGAGSRRDPAGQ